MNSLIDYGSTFDDVHEALAVPTLGYQRLEVRLAILDISGALTVKASCASGRRAFDQSVDVWTAGTNGTLTTEGVHAVRIDVPAGVEFVRIRLEPTVSWTCGELIVGGAR